MRSIGIDLGQWIEKGLMKFHGERPTLYGLEAHLAAMYKLADEFKPAAVVVDPVSNLGSVAKESDVKKMLTHLLDQLKVRGVTTLFTSLTASGNSLEATEVGISSLTDTWLLLRDIEIGGERNRGMYILKSRGMAHSNQIREFLLTDKGVELANVYVGSAGVLTGSARLSQEAQEKANQLLRRQDVELKKINLERKRKAMEAQVAAIHADFEAEKAEVNKFVEQEKLRQRTIAEDRTAMGQMRKAD